MKNQLAVKILEKVQEQIIKKYCVLTPVITSLELRAVPQECILETDGTKIFYQPDTICRMAKRKEIKKIRDCYMHILIHGILFHLADYRKYSMRTLANAVFDLEADLFVKLLEGRGEPSYFQDPIDKQLETKGAEGLYNEAMHSKTLRRQVYRRAKEVLRDHHENWQIKSKLLLGTSGERESTENVSEFWTRMLCSMSGNTGLSINELVANMKGDGKAHGSDSLGMESVVSKDNSSPLNYAEVLRQYLRERESCRVDDENFDRDFYALGMEMYEDVALLEPSEDGNRLALGTIVVAIDTSGSCAGEVVQRFLTQTEGILRTLSQVDYKEMVLIQADAAICREEHIKPGDPFPDFTRMNVFGFGGTDFRPVFQRVEELGETSPVDLIIYLTDAIGNFPENPQRVKTFFVIPDLEKNGYLYGSFTIPAWIECLAI